MAKNKKKVKVKEANNDIEIVVLKCFLRVIKNEGKYMFFRRGINNSGIMKHLLKQYYRPSSDNPFLNCSSNAEIANTLHTISDQMAVHNGNKKGISGLDRYEIVTMTINHLLHFFIEANGVPMEHLCQMGENIYSLSCNILFGDAIEDIEEQQRQQPEIKITSAAQLKAKLFSDFMNGINEGTISKNMPFEEFLKKHKKEFDAFKNEDRIDLEAGHILGRAPEGEQDNGFLNATRLNWLNAEDLPTW